MNIYKKKVLDWIYFNYRRLRKGRFSTYDTENKKEVLELAFKSNLNNDSLPEDERHLFRHHLVQLQISNMDKHYQAIKKERYNYYLDRFFEKLVIRDNDYMKANFINLKLNAWKISKGSRNDKIIRDRSVYCFVEKETGKIMKAASWNAPDPKRYERGNIYNDDPLKGTTIYGTEYMK